MKKKQAIEFSLTDLVRDFKEWRVVILLSGAFFALLSFFYLLLQPLHFTSHGVFKGQSENTPSSLTKFLEAFDQKTSYVSSDEPLVYLKCYPVMENVVRSVSLQASLEENSLKWLKRCKEIWYTLQVEKRYRHLKKLDHNVPLPTRLMVPDLAQPVQCASVDFPEEIARSLKIRFLDATHYKVFNGKKEIGEGTLDLPFYWEHGSFELTGKGKKGKRYRLTFIPMEQAVQNLANSIQLKRDKYSSSLTHIKYTHRDRHLAAKVVNQTMRAFQNYLQAEGERKINKQLHYLHQRQEETFQDLEQSMETHKQYLESHLDAGQMMTLQHEIEFLANKQAEKRHELLQLELEMGRIFQTITEQEAPPFHELLTQLRSEKKEKIHTLTLASANSLVSQHQHSLDQIDLDLQRYDNCLEKLAAPDFDSSSLSKILTDPSLQSRFEKIHTLHRNLIDEKNWSLNERNALSEELETEKKFLIRHIHDLKKGAFLHAEVLKTRIHALQEILLSLYLEQYEWVEKALSDLAQQASHFPEKWLKEQKITLNTKMYTEMIESITKIIEAKNIGYHLDHLAATPLKKATPSPLPHHPHLLLGTLVGGVCGLLLSSLALYVRCIWLGPAASIENLLSEGRHVDMSGDPLTTLTRFFMLKRSILLLTSKQKIPFVEPLKRELHERGECAVLIDTSQDVVSFERIEELREENQSILLVSQQDPHSLLTKELQALADTTVYFITDERWSEIEQLPEKTLFIVEPHPMKKMTLAEIRPLLARLLRQMRSSSSSFLERFPLRRT